MAVWKHTSGRYETDAPGFTVAVVNYGNGYGWYIDEGDGKIRRFFRTAKQAIALAEEYYGMGPTSL